MSASADTERQAAAWLARRESGQWSDADQVELGQWIATSTANRIALLRLESVWRKAGRLRASAREVLSEPGAEEDDVLVALLFLDTFAGNEPEALAHDGLHHGAGRQRLRRVDLEARARAAARRR